MADALAAICDASFDWEFCAPIGGKGGRGGLTMCPRSSQAVTSYVLPVVTRHCFLTVFGLLRLVTDGGAENDGHENVGQENDGPMSRA